MAYLGISKATKDTIILIDEKSKTGDMVPIGEILFSFLDLDLKKYGELYDFSSYNKDFEYTDMQLIIKEYPKTAKKYERQLNRINLEISDDDLRDIALYFLLDNQDNFAQLYEHIAFDYSDARETLPMQYSDLSQEIDFYNIQMYFRKVIDFCFLENDAKLSELTPQERYYLFCALYPLQKFNIHSKKTILFTPSDLFDEIREFAFDKYELPSALSKPNDINLLELVNDDMIKNIKRKCVLLEVNSCSTVYDFIAFDMVTLLFSNSIIKKCANCGKLFIPSGKYNTDCCDRIPEGEKYSCKKIMAQKKRKEKLKGNPIMKEYERAYKRNYARLSNNKLTNEEFRLWVEDATQKRNEISARYKLAPSEQLLLDFKKHLGNK